MTTETTDKAGELRQRLIRIFQIGQLLEDEPGVVSENGK